jgi:hypothetical protein
VDCQHHEDKTAAKIPTWNGRFINLTSHTTLVKLVLSSQAIYQLTMLIVPPGVTDNMEKNREINSLDGQVQSHIGAHVHS